MSNMQSFPLPLRLVVLLCSLTLAATTPYAPVPAACPSDINRAATGISADETQFLKQRLPKANAALDAFLGKTGVTFPSLTAAQHPVIGLTTSGGGSRSLLSAAGVHKGMSIILTQELL